MPRPHDAAVHRCGRDRRGELVSLLRSRQRSQGAIARLDVREVADDVGCPTSQVQGVSTFYAMLRSRPDEQTIRLCDGVVCWLNGSEACLSRPQFAEFESSGGCIERTSCLGLCEQAPAALVGCAQVGRVDQADPIEEAAVCAPRVHVWNEACRVVSSRIGCIDPESIEEAVAKGAYSGLNRARAMSPGDVIDEIEAASLRGRGGAGFSTARKWRVVATAAGARTVVCNADESEPLMFKDRVLMEADPHAVIEGMAIAGYAVGAQRGIVYVRGEYEPQALRMERAITQARAHGWLGGESSGFDIDVHRGAGAYICGEETALLESLEGRRGEPRMRPPYPVTNGYHQNPTVVNNVETLATAAAILRLGRDAYTSLGSRDHPGTRLFTILGHVKIPGMAEAPHGLSTRQLIDQCAGGLRDDATFHFALVGGAAGSFIPESLLDIPLDTAGVEHPVRAGAGGILVCDTTVSVPETLHQLLRFFERESCGKCTPCRVGTSECRRLLERLTARQGSEADLERLSTTAALLKSTSFCGLGTSASDPIQTALRHFPDEFSELVS